ncbi:MAG: RHS repeat-associated core domain-containing protein [Acidimicrobiales bacterium]
MYISSNHNWCALTNVKAQLADVASSATYFQVNGGQELDVFDWTGTFNKRTSSAGYVAQGYGLTYAYNVAPGTKPNGTSQYCPTTATMCSFVYSADGRSIVEAQTSALRTTQLIDPLGNTYNFSYDSNGNLTSMTPYANTSSPGTWNFVYDTAQASPYNSDLVQIYDPDAGVTSPPPANPGAAHSTFVAYNNAGALAGMASSIEDGTGSTTTYSYSTGCATGGCFNPGTSQTTTVTYPAQVPCPSCAAVSSVEEDVYASGVETQTTLGTASPSADSETWQYGWNFGYGASNSTEVITYPQTLSGTVATETVTLDPAGSIISTMDALGNVATSAYSDASGNTPPELLWSYPGSSSNGPNSPPAGSSVYTYNRYGQAKTATDPLGNVTKYAYYSSGSDLCYVVPPTVTGPPNPSCSNLPWQGPDYGTPLGATTYTYDNQGDVVKASVDYLDTATGADPQTWASQYDALGNQIWWDPPPAGGGVGGQYGTYATFTDGNLPSTILRPAMGTTTYTYDAALNPTLVQLPMPSTFTTNVFDADSRLCYTVTGVSQSGLTCSSAAQAGSTNYTYVPGSLSVATSRDANGQTTSSYYGDLAYPDSPTEVVDPTSAAIQYTAYDDFGNVCVSGSVSIAIGMSAQCNTLAGDTTNVYNALGDQTSTTDPSGNTTSYSYANTAFPTLVTSSQNALGAVTNYSYDGDGRLTTTTNPDLTKVTTGYDADSRVCVKADNGNTYSCGGGSGVAGVTAFTYNGAMDRLSMTTFAPSAQTTTYSYLTGQLVSTTDSNAKTVKYLYNYGGQVLCVGYPVSTSTNCGSVGVRQTGSTTNTIVNRTYDAYGRLTGVTDWLGNSTTYAYTTAWEPYSPSTITYPSSTGLTDTVGYNNVGDVSSVAAGPTVNDSWSRDGDERIGVTSINGATSAAAAYNANNQVTQATNLATATNNDTYTVAANASITEDVAPLGMTTSYGYNAGGELCWSANVVATPTCSSPPSGASVLTNYAYSTDGQRASVAATAPNLGSGSISAVGSFQHATADGESTLSVNPQRVGDVLVLGVNVNGSPTVTSVSGGGATWQPLITPDVHTMGRTQLWLGTVTSTGSSTISVSYSQSVTTIWVNLDAQEFTSGLGSSTTWAEDVNGEYNHTSTTSVTMPSLTAASAGELYVGMSFSSAATASGSTPGFTYDPLNYVLFAYDPAVTGTVSPTATTTTAGVYGSVGVLLKAGTPMTTTTDYAWNPYGELCNVSSGSSTACGSTPASGTAYTYNADGLRVGSTAISGSTTTTTATSWDQVSGGSLPLILNDTATTGSSTSTTSYLYGNLLFGGTAPVEQITTTSSGSTAVYLAANPTGVQAVYGSTGAVQEMALYSAYGVQTVTSGSKVTPFAFEGAYSDPTGLIYLVNRYYDPATDQFLSIDPAVGVTGQPYVFTNDNPLNATDPLGLSEFIIGNDSVWEDSAPINFGESSKLGGAGVEPGRGVSEPKPVEEARPTRIKGYTKHGLNQAISRDGVGVSTQAIRDAVSDPLSVSKGANGNWRFNGSNATVVLNSDGYVVSAWARSSVGWRSVK